MVIRYIDGTLDIRYKECAARIKYNAEKRQQRQFKMAKIPGKYAGKNFGDYAVDGDNKVAVAWAKSAVNTPESLYIWGEPGTGKTFLAAIMAQECLKRGRTVIFADVPTLLSELRGTFDKDSDANINDLMKTLSEVELLILDDFGTEQPTQWSIERLYMIINERYNAEKPIVITSNYDLDKAARVMNRPKDGSEGVTGSRIASRLGQMCRLLKLKGEDRRRR